MTPRQIGAAAVIAGIITAGVAVARHPNDGGPVIEPRFVPNWVIGRQPDAPQRFVRAEREQARQIVVQAALTYGEDPALVQAVVHQESGFNPRAVGPSTRWGRACGLGQFLVSTARQYIPGITCRDLMDPRVNARLTVLYLREGRRRCGNDVECIARHHHGGPNLRLHGPRTRAYARAVAAHHRRYAANGPRFAVASHVPGDNSHFQNWWLNR